MRLLPEHTSTRQRLGMKIKNCSSRIFLKGGGSRPCRSPVKMGECAIDLITTTIVDLVCASAGIIFQRNRALDYTLAILHITYYSTGRTARSAFRRPASSRCDRSSPFESYTYFVCLYSRARPARACSVLTRSAPPPPAPLSHVPSRPSLPPHTPPPLP